MTYAKRLNQKIRRSKKKQAEGKHLFKWDLKRLEREGYEESEAKEDDRDVSRPV